MEKNDSSLSMDKGKCRYVGWDTDWGGGNDKEVLDGIIPRDNLILATLSMDNGKCGYFGCISGWFEALRGAAGSHMVDLGCQDTDWVGRNDIQRF